ncbi:zinc finger protein 358-like isoform X2 [Trematomus bernacchii]|nr:zinc finger protein 358-like isoform X2 [Trematomus bernacchii]
MDSETDLSVSEDALGGADFITVELDTQPIEYVVKWAEVGSRFTISCVKRDPDDPPEISEDAFFAPYEEVYPCEVTEQSVEIKTDSDEEEEEEEEEQEEQAGVSQLQEEEEDEEEEEEEEERQYRCSFCGKSYSHASSLYRHQQTHSKGGAAPIKREPPHQEAQYSCPHCGMTFKGSRMLGSHLRLHGKRRIHPCNICGKEFNHSSSLSRHRLVHKKGKGLPKEDMAALRHPQKAGGRRQKSRRAVAQSPPGDTFYACPQCDMSFRTSTQLSKHQVTHVKELLDSYTPGKENLGESSSDLKIRLKLCSRDKPNFYTLCKKNRRRRGGGGAGRPQRPRPLRGGGGGASCLQPMREAFQPRLQPGPTPADPQGGGRETPEAAPPRQDEDLHLHRLQQNLHALQQLLPPQEGSPGGAAAPQEGSPGGAAPQEGSPGGAAPQEGSPGGAAPQEGSPGGAAPQEGSPGGAAPPEEASAGRDGAAGVRLRVTPPTGDPPLRTGPASLV